jgi:GntP family gluconate:H+ symporter
MNPSTHTSFIQIAICMLIGIGLIVLLTSRLRVHAFFALLLACFVVGMGLGCLWTV